MNASCNCWTLAGPRGTPPTPQLGPPDVRSEEKGNTSTKSLIWTPVGDAQKEKGCSVDSTSLAQAKLEGPASYEYIYAWSLSHAARNKVMHIEHGNGRKGKCKHYGAKDVPERMLDQEAVMDTVEDYVTKEIQNLTAFQQRQLETFRDEVITIQGTQQQQFMALQEQLAELTLAATELTSMMKDDEK